MCQRCCEISGGTADSTSFKYVPGAPCKSRVDQVYVLQGSFGSVYHTGQLQFEKKKTKEISYSNAHLPIRFLVEDIL